MNINQFSVASMLQSPRLPSNLRSIMEEKYILALDIGTTTIRSFIYNSNTEIVGKATDQVGTYTIRLMAK